MVKKIQSKSEFDSEIASGKLVVVDFFATWCGPCVSIAPLFENLSKVETEVVFLKVDIDELSDVAEQCGITAMPTFQIYKNKVKVGEVVGASIDKVKQELAKAK